MVTGLGSGAGTRGSRWSFWGLFHALFTLSPPSVSNLLIWFPSFCSFGFYFHYFIHSYSILVSFLLLLFLFFLCNLVDYVCIVCCGFCLLWVSRIFAFGGIVFVAVVILCSSFWGNWSLVGLFFVWVCELCLYVYFVLVRRWKTLCVHIMCATNCLLYLVRKWLYIFNYLYI